MNTYIDAVKARLALLIMAFLEAREFPSVTTVCAWWENEFTRGRQALTEALALLETHAVSLNLDTYWNQDTTGLTLSALRIQFEVTVSEVQTRVLLALQKAGKIPSTLSITKDEFDRFQRLSPNPILLFDSGIGSVTAEWIDGTHYGSGEFGEQMTDSEIRSMKAFIQ